MPTQQERIRRCLSSLLVQLPFYGALALRLEHRVPLTIRLITCDAEVTKDELFPPFVLLPEARELAGRGGTDFRPVFRPLGAQPPRHAVAGAFPFGIAFLPGIRR